MRQRTAARRLRDILEGKGKEFGERVSFWRIQRGMSKDKLASEAGVSIELLHQIIAGKHKPSAGIRRKIAKALLITVAELVE